MSKGIKIAKQEAHMYRGLRSNMGNCCRYAEDSKGFKTLSQTDVNILSIRTGISPDRVRTLLKLPKV